MMQCDRRQTDKTRGMKLEECRKCAANQHLVIITSRRQILRMRDAIKISGTKELQGKWRFAVARLRLDRDIDVISFIAKA